VGYFDGVKLKLVFFIDVINFRTTKQHARQVSNLDREVEQQMEKLEAKVRQEVRI
jgi:hypothetical protein